MLTKWLSVVLLSVANHASAQDADLTIFVAGPLFEFGGVVEVTAVPSMEASTEPQIITVSERYARVQLRYVDSEGYNYRFRPSPEIADREGLDFFQTEALSVGGRTVETPTGAISGDWRSVRVPPFEEYGGSGEATKIASAWGETVGFATPPPANHWGARALPFVFETFGNRRTVGLICTEENTVSVCTPDPDDALLLEALWWRQIAEDRLERLRHVALRDCYDSGSFLARPTGCSAEVGQGWPSYRPD